MGTNFQKNRNDLIEKILKKVREKLPVKQQSLLEKFVNIYYRSVAAEDLFSRKTMDLYGGLLSHWHFFYNRKTLEPKVNVFNPNLEEHGWQSPHTIIEISTEDKPFLVDSIRMALTTQELGIHLIIHAGGLKAVRNSKHNLVDILENEPTIQNKKELESITNEVVIYIEVDKQSSIDRLKDIKNSILDTFNTVDLAVSDWREMCAKVDEVCKLVRVPEKRFNKDDIDESINLLKWLADNNFTFLGYREYKVSSDNGDIFLVPKSNTGLGLLREEYDLGLKRPICENPEIAHNFIKNSDVITISKTNVMSKVHRPAFIDAISVKIADKNGKLLGERLFLGLYTSVAYHSSCDTIPLLRHKVSQVQRLAGFPLNSHDDKTLLNILETLPRDDLFHASVDELCDLAVSILHLQERHVLKLFCRKDRFERFYSCLVYVPRDSFNSDLRVEIQRILTETLNGDSVVYSTRFSESILARLHFVIRSKSSKAIDVDLNQLERKLQDAARTWKEDLHDALIEHFGEEKGNTLQKRYGDGFPASYKENFSPRQAVVDIEYIESLSDSNKLAMSLYRPIEDETSFNFKLYRKDKPIPLSDVVPMLENMGLRIISERPYQIARNGSSTMWINDYKMSHKNGGHDLNAESVKETFQNAFAAIWLGKAENDGFNKLVLSGSIKWRDITVIRGISKYLWQLRQNFSQNYVEDTFYKNADLAAMLIKLFYLKFEPGGHRKNNDYSKLKEIFISSLERVKTLTEDRILRTTLSVIDACVRTNFFQINPNSKENDNLSKYKEYISFKIDSKKVPDIPLPIPYFEIFVYSPKVEGVHLRGGKVARGGLRWSDRNDDFRTEVLGLMKAQQVKNSVIVPMGAKGGFVVKQMPLTQNREEIQAEVVSCYKTFISGLLDITDNIISNEIKHPVDVIRHDDDDPYLVVAADKGTATFSDTANSISNEYNFWLGDAFASGGSAGYDHKKMGITARGAWESVKRHFLDLGIDTQNDDFTVIGIGDMAGDVFGNGMLLSEHIKLVAAYNHMHIFLDPLPDPKLSFQERKRLFELPRSSWSDYDEKLISSGGGVFQRAAKSIPISPEVKKLLNIKDNQLVPNDLIKIILKSKVDLLWNGGIGTFVKAKSETDREVGDRSNDAIRINANELKVKVVGEGGNLGMTQLSRIEYAKLGGRLNTDAIDNSAGVNCSDVEVNIKILLHDVLQAGDITLKQRNQLLVEMTEEVAEIVLQNNRKQNEAISVTLSKGAQSLKMHIRLLNDLIANGNLDRELEFLPDVEELTKRKNSGEGFTRPEISVLMAYVKNNLKIDLVNSTVPDDPFVEKILINAFPKPIQEKYKEYILNHRLKREIIATRIANSVVDEMGITFVHRLKDETGCIVPQIVKAYLTSREIFQMDKYRTKVSELESSVKSDIQLRVLHEINRLVRRGARWFLRNRNENINIQESIEIFSSEVEKISELLPTLLRGHGKKFLDEYSKELNDYNVPINFATEIAGMSAMFSSLDIVEAAAANDYSVEELAKVYFGLGGRLDLGWFRQQIKAHTIANHWEAMARAAFRDDLDRQQRNLAINILDSEGDENIDYEQKITNWLENHKQLVDRWSYFVNELRRIKTPEFTMFAVALRELVDLSKLSM